MEGTAEIVEIRGELHNLKTLVGEAISSNEQIKSFIASTKVIEKELQDLRASAKTASKQAHSTVNLLNELKASAEAALKQIEEDTRKANSESGFAFNAKGNAEEHAKAIAQIKGTVESTFAGLSATKAQTDDAAKAISTLRSTAETEVKNINELKSSATEKSAQIVAANERVTAVMPAIEQATKDANTITAAKAGAEASATAVQQLHSQVTEIRAGAIANSESIVKAQTESKKLLLSMSEAQKTANEANARLTTYEEELTAMQTAFATMNAKLEGLLPHATSAGLASAFHIQRARFSKPQKNWLMLFVFTIVLLVASALVDLPSSDASWDIIFRHLLNRLPIIAPLIWLAVYAGHHYSMALRMEEDYAFKEAVSTAFEGYKREMLGIQSAGEKDVSPLITLCENVLQALAERPGRIYDGKVEVPMPFSPASAMLKDMFTAWQNAKTDRQ